MGTSQKVNAEPSTLEAERNLVTVLPIWADLHSSLQEGRSLLVSAPRYFNSEELVSHVIRWAHGRFSNLKTLTLNVSGYMVTGQLDYTALWDETKRQFGISSKKKVIDKNEYLTAFGIYHQSQSAQILVSLRGGGKHARDNFRQLVDLFHALASDLTSVPVSRRLQFIANDDYSLWYNNGDNQPDWWRAQWKQFGHLSLDEIFRCLKTLYNTTSLTMDLRLISQLVHKLTGGHVGLISLFCDMLDDRIRVSTEPIDIDESEVRRALEASTLMEQLRQGLQEDPAGLCKTALDLRTAKAPPEYGSPRVQMLRQLGILRWINAYEVVLCEGVVQNMVEKVAEALPVPRLGTVTSLGGIKRFEEDHFAPLDQDIVVVHMSDLHFGSDYAYKLVAGVTTHNESNHDLATLLKNDLESLGLVGRVDALVISGDIACNGQYDEYSRATDVLAHILQELGLGHDQLILVPGNHDLQWNPGEYSVRDIGRNVSREPYDLFAERMGKKKGATADLVSITSRSGKEKLRILALDSTDVEGPDAAGIGYIGETSFNDATRLLEADATSGFGAVYNWFVLHHHVTPVTSTAIDDARRRKVSVLGNAPELLNKSKALNVEVVLHGHEHQPSVTQLKWWLGERHSNFGSIVSVCAGSCSAKRERLGPAARNHYFILVRRRNELVIMSRMMGDEGLSFRPHEDLSVNLPSSVVSPKSVE